MFPIEMKIHNHVVGNLNKRYALVHGIVLAVEDHRSVNRA